MNKTDSLLNQNTNPNTLSIDNRSGYFFSNAFNNLSAYYNLKYCLLSVSYLNIEFEFGAPTNNDVQTVYKLFKTSNVLINYSIKAELLENDKSFNQYCDLLAYFFESFLAMIKTDELLGQNESLSPFMSDNYKTIEKMAKSNAAVLIYGETGTGKEFLAHLIHTINKKNKNLALINLASIPEDLFEIELFGYEKGAFTDATVAKMGKFQLAENGTLVLDNIETLSLHQQAKLLHVLQDGTFSPVGSHHSIKLHARLICLSSVNLEKLVQENKFRKDLYYRISILPFYLPPLRERKNDIDFFVSLFCAKNNIEKNKLIQKTAKKVWELHDWPGNIRELHNELHKNLVFQNKTNNFGKPIMSEKSDQKTLKELINLCKKEAIYDTLVRNNGNQSMAAKALGIQRTYLSRLLKEYAESKQVKE